MSSKIWVTNGEKRKDRSVNMVYWDKESSDYKPLKISQEMTEKGVPVLVPNSIEIGSFIKQGLIRPYQDAKEAEKISKAYWDERKKKEVAVAKESAKKTGKITMGGDSAGVAGYDIQRRKDVKVFKKGDMVFGYTSSFRMGQLIRFELAIPKHYPHKEDYEYMCTNFIEAVRELFKSKGYMEIHNNVEEGGHFLVGYKGHLYKVEGDLQVGETYDLYDSVGCGEDFAKGVLFTRKTEKDKKAVVLAALEAAAYHSAGVCEPFNIIEL